MIYNKDIDSGNGFDWSRASNDYAKYRDIYPDEFYQKIVDLGYCKNGQSVLDLATGTGVLPRNMYKFGAKWTGADISENQIKFARELSGDMAVDYVVSPAESLEFEPNSFDVVTACQCFMYFDKSVLIPKIHEWLKPNGHLLVMHMDWLTYESEIALKSEQLVLKYNPDWSGKNTVRSDVSFPDWASGFFTLANAVSFDIYVPFTRESWHGRIKACRGIGASSLSDEEISAWEREHLAMLDSFSEKFNILHYATILDLKKI